MARSAPMNCSSRWDGGSASRCRKIFPEPTMVKGFHLTLMIGPGVPLPVSQGTLDALTSVTVTTNSDSGSGFQLQFTLSNRSPLQTLFLLAGGASIPLVRVVIIMTVNGT